MACATVRDCNIPHFQNADLISSILDDLAFAKVNEVQDAEIDLLCTCLEMSREALSFSEDLLPSCLLGRLGQKDKVHPAIAKLLAQAARPTFDCLYSSQGNPLNLLGPHLPTYFFLRLGHD